MPERAECVDEFVPALGLRVERLRDLEPIEQAIEAEFGVAFEAVPVGDTFIDRKEA